MILLDYETIINIITGAFALCVGIFILFSFYYIAFFIEAFKKPKRFEKGKTNYKYAVLIPARNEDKVIKNILESLKAQDYPKDKFDVYVIVESKDDPTYNIVTKFGYKCLLRTNLVNRRTKGFALQEAIEQIWESKIEYDSVIIFDADNIMNKDFISLLNDVKNKGYQVGVGYRNFTNATVNWVSACSATLFSFMNNFTSKGRSRYLKKATITGTGYFIDMQVIKDAGGWIWTGLTEDCELTTYCYYHDVAMTYYPYAVYYDEQPTKSKVLHDQHIRWIYGFFNSKKKFKKDGVNYNTNSKFVQWVAKFEYNFCIWPFVTFALTCFLAMCTGFGLFVASFFKEGNWPYDIIWTFSHFLLYLSFLYLAFMLVAIISISLDNKNLKFKPSVIIKVIFTYVFFFGDFLYAFLDGLFHKKKRSVWKAISHDGEILDKQALEAHNNEK